MKLLSYGQTKEKADVLKKIGLRFKVYVEIKKKGYELFPDHYIPRHVSSFWPYKR